MTSARRSASNPSVSCPDGHQHRAKLTPRAHGVWLQFERTPEARHCLRAQLAPCQIVGLGRVCDAELQMRARVACVEIDRMLEQHHRSIERLVALRPQVEHAFGERLICAHHPGFQRRRPGRANDGPQEIGKIADQPILQDEDLLHSAIHLDRPLGMGRCRVQQMRRDAHRVGRALKAAREHPSRTELAANADPKSLALIAALALERPGQLGHASARHHRHALESFQVGGQGFRNPGAEPVVLGVRT